MTVAPVAAITAVGALVPEPVLEAAARREESANVSSKCNCCFLGYTVLLWACQSGCSAVLVAMVVVVVVVTLVAINDLASLRLLKI